MEDLSNDPQWLAWLADRPPEIQQLAKDFPPWVTYEVQGGINPGYIVSYSEFKKGGVGFQCAIHDPFMPRIVFGLKPEHLKPWPEGKPLNPWGDITVEAEVIDTSSDTLS